MKKKVLIILAVLTLSALLAAGTWAWFTAQADPVTNTFTAGTVAIELHDEFAEGGIDNWNPGDCTNKVIYVENTGSKAARVRVRLTMAWYDGEEEEFGLSTDNVDLGDLGEGWTLDEDGWYYYEPALEGTKAGSDNAKTSKLIEKVCLDGPSTGNEYQGKTLQIKVEAQAIQASNNATWEDWTESGVEANGDN